MKYFIPKFIHPFLPSEYSSLIRNMLSHAEKLSQCIDCIVTTLPVSFYDLSYCNMLGKCKVWKSFQFAEGI